MEYADLSDLEEGEIIEFESVSPSDSKCNDVKINGCSFPNLKKEYKNYECEMKRNQDNNLYLCEQEKYGSMSQTLKNGLKIDGKLENIKSNMSMIDLESISSEEEHKSDEENKYSDKNKCKIYSEDKKGKKKQSTQFYGTVEDIMSEIGETICRKSHCNYKKRKSKESQFSFDKYSEKSYNLWSHKIFSSHLKNKKHKRNVCFSDSDTDSDSAKERVERRKKKKKRREIYYEKNKKTKKNTELRDFDEMRRAVLERLKKQKAAEESKAAFNGCATQIENSKIQEVDMLMDCTNYVDNSKDEAPEYSAGEEGIEQKEPEDELDLIKLRLIALASNKRQKSGEVVTQSVKAEDVSLKKKMYDDNKREVDLDRNELLLRAEALKTALLKKHEKRLNRLKLKKTNRKESGEEHEGVASSLGENTECLITEGAGESLNADAGKESMEKESEEKGAGSLIHVSYLEGLEGKINELNETPSESSVSESLIKTLPRTKIKRKKKKSGSFSNNIKENNDKSEPLEEDDRTLRSQLLRDLMKKKSLKTLEKESVLLDSICQQVASKPLVINSQSPKENVESLPLGRKASVKKVNPSKIVKPVMATKVPKAEIQRIIVHLGSEDSSDEDDTSCQGLPRMEESKEKEKENEKCAIMNFTHVNKLIQADYERSVELLLSQARKKIEGEKRTANESAVETPEAVYKHLPPSQRLEYMRLKQKIAERERLRQKRTKNSDVFASVNPEALEISAKDTSTGKKTAEHFFKQFKPKPESITEAAIKPASFSSNSGLVFKSSLSLSKPSVVLNSPFNNKTVGEVTSLNGLKTKHTTQLRILNNAKNNSEEVCGKKLPLGKEVKPDFSIRRSGLLLPSSQALISKLKLLLKKIKIEKTIEENYDKEIVKLRNQLSLLEKKKTEQRFKIKKLGEESIKTYKEIQDITAKSNEKSLPKENEGEPKKKEGGDNGAKDEGNKPQSERPEGKIVSKEPETELNEAQSKADERLHSNEETNEAVARGTTAGVNLLEYHSPLQVFNKLSDGSEKVDPNVMMCQFDLTGVCKDDECAYQHLRSS